MLHVYNHKKCVYKYKSTTKINYSKVISFIYCKYLFYKEHDANSYPECRTKLFSRHTADMCKCFIAHSKKKEHIYERLSAWKTVREVEAMPDKVRYIKVKSCKKRKYKN